MFCLSIHSTEGAEKRTHNDNIIATSIYSALWNFQLNIVNLSWRIYVKSF